MPRPRRDDATWRRGAIVIVDAAHFTDTVLRRGISTALRDIWTMRRLLLPVFRAHGGEVYKVEADNLFVFFEEVAPAVEAAAAAHATLARASARRRRQALAVAIGIGYGRLLYFPGEDDYYGEEVNLASKLGEDVAKERETLVTAAAARELVAASAAPPQMRRRSVSVSGIRISCCRLIPAVR